MTKNIKLDFEWNNKFYGHKEFKRKNGRVNKFYVADNLASNGDFNNAIEITANEHQEIAEKYYRAFGR